MARRWAPGKPGGTGTGGGVGGRRVREGGEAGGRGPPVTAALPRQERPEREGGPCSPVPGQRRGVPLREKLFQRDLEVTLALSLNEYLGNKDSIQKKDDRAEPKAAIEDFKQETVLCTPETDNDENLCAKSVGKPLKTSSPSVTKKPSWTPPGASGSKTSPLGRTPVRSPVHGLRLGLSRLAKVKPLHPPCVGT
ncbi:hypothetical protein E2320_005887 [Naja naja]|nr:hypothetical protein E2320_005887 [Naja naja]